MHCIGTSQRDITRALKRVLMRPGDGATLSEMKLLAGYVREGYGRKLSGSGSTPDDLLNEAICNALDWLERNPIPEFSKLKPWFDAILRNAKFDIWRAHDRQSRPHREYARSREGILPWELDFREFERLQAPLRKGPGAHQKHLPPWVHGGMADPRTELTLDLVREAELEVGREASEFLERGLAMERIADPREAKRRAQRALGLSKRRYVRIAKSQADYFTQSLDRKDTLSEPEEDE